MTITRTTRRGALVALVPVVALAAVTCDALPTPAQVVPLRAVVNGRPVPVDGDAIVHDGVVMVPYQGLFAPLGIRAAWDPTARVLTLRSPAGDEMELRPDDPYATVNGERRPIPIPLVTVLGRVLIPAQWVFETLGDVTSYDPATRTLTVAAQLTDLTWRAVADGLEVALEGTGPLRARVTPLRGPDRLVVDLPGTVPKASVSTVDVHEGPLATIRIARTGAGTRIVLDLLAPARYTLEAPADRRRAVLTLWARTPPPAAPGEASSYTPSAQKLTDIRYEPLAGGGRVVILSTLPLHAVPRVFRNPDRLVLDVPDAVFLPVKKFVDVNDGVVVQVRAAQFHSHPNVVRVVIQLARPVAYALRAGAEPGRTVIDLGSAVGDEAGRTPAPRGSTVVAIDAGHGGTDPGAIGPGGVREKDVTLAIAEALRLRLLRQHMGVVMVREGDVFVPLDDRARIAQRGGATLFVSIHANASVDPDANGTQTFYATPQSAPLAQAVVDEVSRATGLASRGATPARFKVLVDSDRIPAILVETAFITNPREERLLQDPAMQQRFAEGMTRGILRFLAAPASAP
jgi:N-acetylmuramoyl-L-alanine amidase